LPSATRERGISHSHHHRSPSHRRLGRGVCRRAGHRSLGLPARPTQPGDRCLPGHPRHCGVRATGDLARRKLLPGLFHLAAAGLMPDRYGSSAHPARAWPASSHEPPSRRSRSSVTVCSRSGAPSREFW